MTRPFRFRISRYPKFTKPFYRRYLCFQSAPTECTYSRIEFGLGPFRGHLLILRFPEG